MFNHHDRKSLPDVSRRGFLQVAGLATAAAVLPVAASSPRKVRNGKAGEALHIIFMVSDGMSMGAFGLADHACQVQHSRRSHWSQLMNRAETRMALLDTSSANGYVTDSSAAACAWGCGELFNNNAMGYTPDGRTPVPILPHAKQSGKFVGVATSTRVTHATPAGFCCNVSGGRGAEKEIGAQMLDRRIDLILGGGRNSFGDFQHANDSGYRVLKSRQELMTVGAGAEPGLMLGAFSDSHLAYEIDRLNDEKIRTEQPSLAELTDVALRIASSSASGSRNGFFLQIEGARIDHAAHANDALGLLFDQIAFDDAVAVAMKFVDQRDDTLLIVCTDHGNANPGLTEYGPSGIASFAKLLDGGRRSYEWIFEQFGKSPTPDRITDVVAQATGVTLDAGEVALVHTALTGGKPHPFKMSNSGANVLGAVLANHTGVAFLSPNHTADPVLLSAFGPGSESFTGHLTMPEVHAAMVSALGLPAAKPLS
jgi:alkaline phosphatase